MNPYHTHNWRAVHDNNEWRCDICQLEITDEEMHAENEQYHTAVAQGISM